MAQTILQSRKRKSEQCQLSLEENVETAAETKLNAISNTHTWIQLEDKIFQLSIATLPRSCILTDLDLSDVTRENPLWFDRNVEYFQIVLNYLRSRVFHVPNHLSFALAIKECRFWGVFLPSDNHLSSKWTHERTYVLLYVRKNDDSTVSLMASGFEVWSDKKWHADFIWMLDFYAPAPKTLPGALAKFIEFLQEYSWRILVPLTASKPEPSTTTSVDFRNVNVELVR